MTPSTLRHTLELLPCPFCGSAAKLEWSFGTRWVICTACGCTGHGGEGEDDTNGEITHSAIEHWNKRATLPPEGAAEDPTPRPASSSEIGEVVAELCTAAATLQNDDHSKPETIERRRHVQRVEAINHARDLLLILAAIAQRQSPHAPTRDSLAYFETHEPPHCPTCDCGTPPPAPECEGGQAVACKVVPAEPTDAMMDEGHAVLVDRHKTGSFGECPGLGWGDARECYKAMIAAAPTDPVRREARLRELASAEGPIGLAELYLRIEGNADGDTGKEGR